MTDLLREAMSYRAAGLAVVTTRAPAGADLAATVSSFASVSLHPPLAMICVRSARPFHRALLARGVWAATLLAVDQEDLAVACARPQAQQRPEDVRQWVTKRMPGGSLAFPHGLAAVECATTATVEAGTSTLVLGLVTATLRGSGAAPLMYFRRQYRRISDEPSSHLQS